MKLLLVIINDDRLKHNDGFSATQDLNVGFYIRLSNQCTSSSTYFIISATLSNTSFV